MAETRFIPIEREVPGDQEGTRRGSLGIGRIHALKGPHQADKAQVKLTARGQSTEPVQGNI